MFIYCNHFPHTRISLLQRNATSLLKWVCIIIHLKKSALLHEMKLFLLVHRYVLVVKQSPAHKLDQAPSDALASATTSR